MTNGHDHDQEYAEDETVGESVMNAVHELLGVIFIIAVKHKVCPVCLTYMTAGEVEEAEEAGKISHGVPADEDALSVMPVLGGAQ